MKFSDANVESTKETNTLRNITNYFNNFARHDPNEHFINNMTLNDIPARRDDVFSRRALKPVANVQHVFRNNID